MADVQAIRDDIYEYVGDDYPLLGLLVDLEAAIRSQDMDQVTVTIDGKDHKSGYGGYTMCMVEVPHGTAQEEGAKPCPTCFPKDEVAPEPELVLSIATPAEDLGSYENPDADPVEEEAVEETPAKPAKKATKAG